MSIERSGFTERTFRKNDPLTDNDFNRYKQIIAQGKDASNHKYLLVTVKDTKQAWVGKEYNVKTYQNFRQFALDYIKHTLSNLFDKDVEVYGQEGAFVQLLHFKVLHAQEDSPSSVQKTAHIREESRIGSPKSEPSPPPKPIEEHEKDVLVAFKFQQAHPNSTATVMMQRHRLLDSSRAIADPVRKELEGLKSKWVGHQDVQKRLEDSIKALSFSKIDNVEEVYEYGVLLDILKDATKLIDELKKEPIAPSKPVVSSTPPVQAAPSQPVERSVTVQDIKQRAASEIAPVKLAKTGTILTKSQRKLLKVTAYLFAYVQAKKENASPEQLHELYGKLKHKMTEVLDGKTLVDWKKRRVQSEKDDKEILNTLSKQLQTESQKLSHQPELENISKIFSDAAKLIKEKSNLESI